MKYLIHHTKEFIITLGVFVSVAVVLAWVVTAIVKSDFSYEHMTAVVGVIFEMLGWYFNMPTSSENSEATIQMRLLKKKPELDDEYFEPEEGEDDE